MTRQESFKRRVRARMEKTGERYGAARRSLLAKRAPGQRIWHAQPATSESSLRAATGRGWDEWCDLIDAWPGHDDGHPAVAAYLSAQHGVDGWWAQSITVGWERITGRRVPHQQADGSFTAGKTRTVAVDAALLRELLEDEGARADLFPGLATELRSRPSARNVRLAMGTGTAEIALERKSDGRTTVTVAHGRLPGPDAVEEWKAYWAAWLGALAEG